MRDSLSKLSPAAQAAMLDTDTGVRSSLRVSLMGEDMRKSSFIYRRTPNSSSTQDIANAIEVAEQSTNSSIVSGSPVAAKNPLLHKNNPDV